MEDNQYAIFNKEEKQVIYKQILQPDECIELNDYLMLMIHNNRDTINRGNLVTGHRSYVDITLRDYPDLSDNLFRVLDNYFTDLKIDPNVRLYSQIYGSIKPHTDKSHDGLCNYTLIIYLTDDFDDGALSIKMKRTKEELKIDPNMKHKVFTIKPIVGYGVIFNKELLHWASEVYMGSKNICIIHLYSSS
jgi:hypothetical protein